MSKINQNIGHILDIISLFGHLLDIIWTHYVVWTLFGHTLDTFLARSVQKVSVPTSCCSTCFLHCPPLPLSVPQSVNTLIFNLAASSKSIRRRHSTFGSLLDRRATHPIQPSIHPTLDHLKLGHSIANDPDPDRRSQR